MVVGTGEKLCGIPILSSFNGIKRRVNHGRLYDPGYGLYYKNKEAVGKKFNLIASPETNLTLEDFFGLMKKHYPFTLKSLPYKEWRKQWEDDKKQVISTNQSFQG
jgi:hypothetical protein